MIYFLKWWLVTKRGFVSSIFCSHLLHFSAQDPKTKKNPPLKKFLIFPKMELSSSNINKILAFPQKKAFLIFPEIEPCTFQPKLENKKNPPGEHFLYFRKQKPRQIFLDILKRKLFLYFRKRKPRNFFLHSRKRNFLEKVYSETRHIQNPGEFRTRSIFRTLVYLEPEANPEHCQHLR